MQRVSNLFPGRRHSPRYSRLNARSARLSVNDSMSIPHLIMSASTVVQLVMLILVVGSILSWVVIFQRTFVMRRARAAHQSFEERVWSGVDLNELYRATPGEQETPGAGAVCAARLPELYNCTRSHTSVSYSSA